MSKKNKTAKKSVKHTKTMKGGVVLKEGYTIQTAFDYFMEHAECRILTDSSISCITYVCEFKPNPDASPVPVSPYKAIRTNNVFTPVNKILLKIMLNSDRKEYIYFNKSLVQENPRKNFIEVNTIADITEEIDIQNKLYSDSFRDENSYLEAICPCIITYDNSINTQEKKFDLQIKLLRNFKERRYIDDTITEAQLLATIPAPHPEPDGTLNKYINVLMDKDVTTELFKKVYENPQYNISIIVMELLDGYDTLETTLDKIKKSSLDPVVKNEHKICVVSATMYELCRLSNKFKIQHNDSHLNNIMIFTNVNEDSDTSNNNENSNNNSIVVKKTYIPYFPIINTDTIKKPKSVPNFIKNVRAIIIDFGRVKPIIGSGNFDLSKISTGDMVRLITIHKKFEKLINPYHFWKYFNVQITLQQLTSIIHYLNKSRIFQNECIKQMFEQMYHTDINTVLANIRRTNQLPTVEQPPRPPPRSLMSRLKLGYLTGGLRKNSIIQSGQSNKELQKGQLQEEEELLVNIKIKKHSIKNSKNSKNNIFKNISLPELETLLTQNLKTPEPLYELHK